MPQIAFKDLQECDVFFVSIAGRKQSMLKVGQFAALDEEGACVDIFDEDMVVTQGGLAYPE